MHPKKTAVAKTAYSVRFDGPTGPELIVHARHTTPALEGISLPISRKSMACILRRWRAIGAPRLTSGPSYATTALMSMGQLGKLEICAP